MRPAVPRAPTGTFRGAARPRTGAPSTSARQPGSNVCANDQTTSSCEHVKIDDRSARDRSTTTTDLADPEPPRRAARRRAGRPRPRRSRSTRDVQAVGRRRRPRRRPRRPPRGAVPGPGRRPAQVIVRRLVRASCAGLVERREPVEVSGELDRVVIPRVGQPVTHRHVRRAAPRRRRGRGRIAPTSRRRRAMTGGHRPVVAGGRSPDSARSRTRTARRASSPSRPSRAAVHGIDPRAPEHGESGERRESRRRSARATRGTWSRVWRTWRSARRR